MGMWMLALAAVAGLLIPEFPSPKPLPKEVGYSEFLSNLDKGHVRECDVGVDDVLRFKLKSGDDVFSSRIVTAPKELQDKMLEKGVTFKQVDSIIGIDAAGGGVAAAALSAALYAVSGLGLYFMSKHFDEKEKHVAFKADETTFDKSISFDDIAGMDSSKALVMEVVDIMKNPGKYSKVGAKLPKGILLCGPPGTGKTLLARCIASEASLPFFFCSGSDFVEMFVGRGAARVRDLFERARSAVPSVIFIDELDALGKQRGRGFSGNDEGEQTLNQLLACMDGIDTKGGPGVVCIAATNRVDILDEALVRPGRFDRVIKVGLPDEKGRKAVLKVHTRTLPLDGDVDLDALAKAMDAMSPAEIAGIVNEAAISAARRAGEKIRQSDFEQALTHFVVSRSRGGQGDAGGERQQQQSAFDEQLMRFLIHQQQQFGDDGNPTQGHIYRETTPPVQS